MDELVEQARLADAGLADWRDDLTVARSCEIERLLQRSDLGLPTDERRKSARRGGLESSPAGGRGEQLERFDRGGQPSNWDPAKAAHVDQPFDEPECLGREADGARDGKLLHPRRQMGGWPDRRVLHIEVVGDAADHDLARVESDASQDLHPVLLAHHLAVAANGVLHRQRGVAGSSCVVFVGERRSEQRHEPVPHHSADGPLEPVDGLDHRPHGRLQQRPAVLGVQILDQLGGADDIGEQDGDLLALAFEIRAAGQDLLGEVAGGMGVERWRMTRLGGGRDCLSTPIAEAGARP